MPAVPLRSALTVLIENHLHKGGKAGNGALRIGDAGLGSAQASENPIYGTTLQCLGPPYSLFGAENEYFIIQMIHEMLLVGHTLWEPLSGQSMVTV